MLKPVFMAALFIRTMDAFTVFDLVYILTFGGPGMKTEVLNLYAFNNAFRYFRFGFASAVSIAILIFLLIISGSLVRVFRERQEAAP